MGMAVSIPSTEINSENATTTNGATVNGTANGGKWAKLKSAVCTENPLVKKCGQLLSDRKE